MRSRLLLLAGLSALQPVLLGGCVAAVVPVVAGGMIARKQIDRKPPRPPKGEVQVVPIAEPAASPAARAATAKALTPRQKRREERAARKRAHDAAKAAASGGRDTRTPLQKQRDARRERKAERDAARATATGAAPRDARTPLKKRRDERLARKRERDAAKSPSRQAQVSAANGEPLPARLRAITDGDIAELTARPGAPVPLAGLSALPAPGSASGSGGAPFTVFARYALAAAQPRPGQPFRSALLDPATLTSAPKRGDCGQQQPAVLIDLDPAKGSFDLDNPPAATAGLTEQLAALRGAGITILWTASLPAASSERLYATLAATGLDTDRTDRLLLLRKPGERKQARRQAAARDWCVLAMAGDTKGDFEEAFDYLRDPDGPIAQALTANLGDGWFLTPQPID